MFRKLGRSVANSLLQQVAAHAHGEGQAPSRVDPNDRRHSAAERAFAYDAYIRENVGNARK